MEANNQIDYEKAIIVISYDTGERVIKTFPNAEEATKYMLKEK